MIEPVLDLFKIHREMILGNPSVVVQDMFCKTPKSLNAVDMILAAVGKGLAVVQPVVFSPAPERVVAPKRIRVVDRSFSRMLPDMGHELIGRDLLHDLCVYPAVPFQEAKYNAFPGGASSALSLPPAAEVGLVKFNLALQLARFKLCNMVDRLTQALVDASDRLVVQAKVACHAIGGLLLVEAGEDRNFTAQLFQRLLFSTAFFQTFHISSFRLAHLERTAENTLSTPQKVGRTIENVLFLHNLAVY